MIYRIFSVHFIYLNGKYVLVSTFLAFPFTKYSNVLQRMCVQHLKKNISRIFSRNCSTYIFNEIVLVS